MWAGLGVALLLVGSGQTWVTGTAVDSVLGGTRVEVSGSQAGTTLVAGSLLAGAALLAGLVGTRPVRLAAALCLMAASVLAGLPALRALTAPRDVVAAVAADRPGVVTTGLRIEDAATTGWPWVALVGAVAVLLAGVLCVLMWLRTPPADGPDADGTEAGPGGTTRRVERPSDPWEDLSRGHDPTLED